MPAGDHRETITIQISEPELHRFQSVAASQGISVQEAIHQALDAWAASAQRTEPSLDELQGSLAGADFESLRRAEKEAERVRESRW